MAILFDEVDDYFSIANAGDMDFPSGDWCVGIWTYVTDNTGSYWQYLLSTNGYDVTPAFNLYLNEINGTWQVNYKSDNGTSIGSIGSSTGPGADSTWRLIIVQRDTTASEIQLWFCTFKGTPSKQASTSDAGLDGMTGQGWNIGRRTDGDSNRYYGSVAGEFFKIDAALSQGEIAALGAGAMPWEIGYEPDVYIPMHISAATLYEWFGDNDASRTSAPTTAEHPPVIASTGAQYINAGAVSDIVITPTPAALGLSGVDPGVVLGALTITPTPAALGLSGVDPGVIEGSITITPTPAALGLSVSGPVVVVTGAGAVCSPREAVLPRIEPAEYQILVYGVENSSPPWFTLLGAVSPKLFLWSFRYRVAPNKLGSFTGTIDADSEFASLFSWENRILVVKRRIPGRDWRIENAYMVKYIDPERTASAHKLTIGGYDLNFLAHKQNIVPPASSTDGYLRVEGDADYVIKRVANLMIGPSSPAAQKIPSLRIEGFTGAGADASATGRYAETTLELMQQAAQTGNIDFWFDFLGADGVVLRAGDFGTDRTVISNPGGPYVVFSERHGNMIDVRHMQDWRETWRAVDVLGAGEGADQEVETVAPGGILAIHPWSRFRRSITARNLEPGDTLGFTTQGNQALDEHRGKDALDFKARQIPACRYGLHYFAGDRITVRYNGLDKVYRIKALEVYLSGEGETIIPEFEPV